VSFWDNGIVPVPALCTSPIDGGTGIPSTGRLNWRAVANAEGYFLNIGTDNPPSDTHNMVDTGNTPLFDYAGLTPDTQYYWQVIPYNSVGNAVNCPVWSFTTFNQVPNSSVEINPVNESSCQNVYPYLLWANRGNSPDGYRIYLGTDNPPTNVLNGLDVGFSTSYTLPTQLAYSTDYFWKVVPYNSVGDAVNCPVWSFTTHPAGMVILGDEMLLREPLPFEDYEEHCYSQTIHTSDEIRYPGIITDISFYFKRRGETDNLTQLVVYLGLTPEDNFDTPASWIPFNSLTEVWNGTMLSETLADGWMCLTLPEANRFVYDGSQNLVVAVKKNRTDMGGSGYDFYCSEKQNNRSIFGIDNNFDINTDNPPDGELLSCIPNTRLTTIPLTQTSYPLITPTTLDFAYIDTGNTSETKSIQIRNSGGAPLILTENITLTGDDADEFILTDNNTYPMQIAYMETVSLDVSFSPSSVGSKNAFISFSDNSPDDADNQPRQIHNIPISGYGYIMDDNDTPATATQVQADLFDYEGVIFPETDIDWYVFWQTAPANIQIYTEAGSNSHMDTYMCVYGPYSAPDINIDLQNLIVADDDSHGNSQPEIRMQISESGFYYIRLSHISNVPDGRSISGKREQEQTTVIGVYNLTINSNNEIIPPDFLPPVNLTGSSLYNGVKLTWEVPIAPQMQIAGCNLFRNNALINTEPITSHTYIDEDVTVGEDYEYKVSTIYSLPSGESETCDPILWTHLEVQPPIIGENFENYENFTTDFVPWTTIDTDMQNTYGFTNGINYPNEHSPMSFIVFNPAATTPPVSYADAYRGAKYAACFAADTGTNEDWLITPQIELGANSSLLSFWARSYTTQYGFEQLRVCLSTEGNEPDDFTQIGGTEPIYVPLAWTCYTFDLSEYAEQQIYLAFLCCSAQTFFLMLDDIVVDSEGGTLANYEDSTLPIKTQLLNNYPNPFNPVTNISFNLNQCERVNINIYNIKGQKVINLTNQDFPAGHHNLVWNGTDRNNHQVSSGIYFFKMEAGTYTHTKKMILIK
ncbi:MAG: choice-of-anchor J domain-containing protein, partial [Candidatus Cloacimonetes bacterium]|nr:choice-of-anchor J domain-containing protein [Candidatus Cloacimonadota bacterium]